MLRILFAVMTLSLFFFAAWPLLRSPREPYAGESLPSDDPPANTLSIVAYDPKNGDLGVAVASKVLGVGCIVPWGKAGVGAIATQSHANTAYGPLGLELLKEKSASEVVELLTTADPGRDFRQLGIVDSQGRVASYTGAGCDAWAGQIVGENFAVQGNLLTGEEVLKAMADSYRAARESGEGELGDWLAAALGAGVAAGGDKRGKQSAALMVYRAGAGYGGNDRYIDLRVDDHQEPEKELARLLEVHKEFFAHAHRRESDEE
ncbi:DUF1028 domain-containing protein [Blastopirellula sp. JC732]|uniref:DUF1028 domain-containing protein n=1 Tax=Blastopirellula sediminis TaxID=2894196 RepID=A0A9X1MKI0_9BACT|nr:DUF1028 domain-containing protein [Blastopirellula sediminis]MCC9608732.1 DUF1028 domain-containing protein [Blastopirellula sediminis]MCC9628491.1 DUF1028 domain-containing protein [Blastopirellula sediminis]